MKKILIIYLTLFSITIIGQNTYKIEKTDSLNKNKNQIYSDTKMFIAETWKSAKDVIQNDDKENGVILVKGSFIEKFSFMMGEYIYIYNYNVTFKMKDNKYKIILDEVYCDKAYFGGNGQSIKKIEPFDGDNAPELNGGSGLPKKKAIIMMSEVRNHLQSIIDRYSSEIIKPSKLSSDW